MASIEMIRNAIKGWKAHDGSVRYYVNDWQSLIGLHVSYYNTGNVSGVYFDARETDDLGECSNSAYRKYIAGAKVWFDESAQIHIDYLGDHLTPVRNRILLSVDAAYSAPAPVGPRNLVQTTLEAF